MTPGQPRVLVAPDKFKGSLTAGEVAGAVRRGILRARPKIDVRSAPVADGGDGTLEAAVAAGFTRVPVTVSGPTGAPVRSSYARRGDCAVIEMADASGLGRLPGGRLAPLTASSRGTGELIAAAVRDGCRQLVLGVGGSACTDGGAGMVRALGATLLDDHGRPLAEGGGALLDLHDIDLSRLLELQDVEVVVACDVDNPLLGPHGAAAVYGPQKGASPEQVTLLDGALGRWADLLTARTRSDFRDVPGAGAAGGLGYAAVSLLGAELRPGIDLLLDMLDFDAVVRDVDWVIVGEGSLDEQTMRGKAPVGVASRARSAGARVVAVCGHCSVDPDQLGEVGIDAAFALTSLEPDVERCMAEADQILEGLAHDLAVRGTFDES